MIFPWICVHHWYRFSSELSHFHHGFHRFCPCSQVPMFRYRIFHDFSMDFPLKHIPHGFSHGFSHLPHGFSSENWSHQGSESSPRSSSPCPPRRCCAPWAAARLCPCRATARALGNVLGPWPCGRPWSLMGFLVKFFLLRWVIQWCFFWVICVYEVLFMNSWWDFWWFLKFWGWFSD